MSRRKRAPTTRAFYRKEVGKMNGVKRSPTGINKIPDPERPKRVHDLMCEIRALIDHMAFTAVRDKRIKDESSGLGL